MKKIIITICFLLISNVFAFDLQECYRIFPKEPDELFLNAISVINSSKEYVVSEIQSKNGYILFMHRNKYYLLTVTKKYKNQTEIKILPQNGDYSEGSIVALDIFNLINNQIKYNPLEQIK